MTSNEDSHDQPALWNASVGARTSRVAARPSRRASVGVSQQPSAPIEVSDLWTIEEVADYLGVPKQTVYAWRTARYGPQGFRVGKHLRWRATTVVAWTVEMERGQ